MHIKLLKFEEQWKIYNTAAAHFRFPWPRSYFSEVNSTVRSANSNLISKTATVRKSLRIRQYFAAKRTQKYNFKNIEKWRFLVQLYSPPWSRVFNLWKIPIELLLI